MAVTRLSEDRTEIFRRTTDGDFDWMAEWAQKNGISNPVGAFRDARDYFSPKKDLEALAERIDGLREKYQPLEDSDFDGIAARNFNQGDVVDAMGEEVNSFNRRHTRRFMKESGRLQMFPSREGHFSRLLTDGRENKEETPTESKEEVTDTE